MRTAFLTAVLLLSCEGLGVDPRSTTPEASPAGARSLRGAPTGGLVDGVCVPTTQRDAAGVVTTTGLFGHLGSPHVGSGDAVIVVWRSATIESPLELRADRLDSSTTARVEWPAARPNLAPVAGSPWPAPAYIVHLKPLSPGCWRLYPVTLPAEHGFVITLAVNK